MSTSAAQVHVVSWDGDGLASALTHSAARHVRVVRWNAFPHGQGVRAGDVLVLDIARGARAAAHDLRPLHLLLPVLPTYAVLCQGPLDAGWVQVLREPALRIVRVDLGAADPYRPAVHALQCHLGRIDAEWLADEVMKTGGTCRKAQTTGFVGVRRPLGHPSASRPG